MLEKVDMVIVGKGLGGINIIGQFEMEYSVTGTTNAKGELVKETSKEVYKLGKLSLSIKDVNILKKKIIEFEKLLKKGKRFSSKQDL